MRRATAALGVVIVLVAQPPAVAQDLPASEVVVSGLGFPAGIAFRSDGTMFINERAGAIRVVVEGQLQAEPLATIPSRTAGETGLLGLTMSPDDNALFAFATDPDGIHNSVWKVPLDDPGGSFKVIEGLPAALYHNGGGVAFDHDGMLLVSNGEQHSSDKAQDPGALGGKIYRYTAAGAIPEDNPFGESPAFAIGLRNPFGLAVDPLTGAAWVTDNGPESFDELNRAPAGANLGWPLLKGPGQATGLLGDPLDPVIAYEDIIVPTGLAFAGEGASDEVAGDLFFGTFGEESLHQVKLNEARTKAIADTKIEVGDPVIAVAWGPEGLYFSTPEEIRLLRVASPGEVATPGSGVDLTAESDRSLPWALLIPLAVLLAVLGVTARGRKKRRARAPLQ